jgi:hypothetical protein
MHALMNTRYPATINGELALTARSILAPEPIPSSEYRLKYKWM